MPRVTVVRKVKMADTKIEWTDATWKEPCRWMFDHYRWLRELLCDGDGKAP